MTLEQIVRSILERATEDGLVAPMENLEDPDPRSRSDEELRGCVTVLRECLKLKPGTPPEQAFSPPHWTAAQAPVRGPM